MLAKNKQGNNPGPKINMAMAAEGRNHRRDLVGIANHPTICPGGGGTLWAHRERGINHTGSLALAKMLLEAHLENASHIQALQE